ncbi:MAG: DUF302 domain-containing protein [bacterium]|nr:DUF302 domain-containing protein [bacterium]
MYTTSYAFGVETTMSFEEARQRVEALLKDVGFGILTEIDVKATMKKKLGAEFRPYVILGACNPQIAHEAFKRELEIGSLLPCNVIVYENDKGGTNVSFMDPIAALGLTGNKELTQQANQVRELLQQVAAKL